MKGFCPTCGAHCPGLVSDSERASFQARLASQREQIVKYAALLKRARRAISLADDADPTLRKQLAELFISRHAH